MGLKPLQTMFETPESCPHCSDVMYIPYAEINLGDYGKTLARYADLQTAKQALCNLQSALYKENNLYIMDESIAVLDEYRPRNGYHGKKVKRRGGSCCTQT